ncbi:MAG: hypothetical protein F6K11_23595 [Leptolyngbya sp. SIO3F4]|nr:hypothetical protein [Leptolyngbya sp. SIO3F4]
MTARAESVILDFAIDSTEGRLAQPSEDVVLTFGLPARGSATQDSLTLLNDVSDHPLTKLFKGDSKSLVAKAVGSAEGTRTPKGEYTSAYYGHVDPGNGVWNLGSFSYQHGAASPEDADRKQLKRLERQALALRHQAKAKQIKLTLLEELNGIDLANQAPLAALDRGYIDWLYEAKQMPMNDMERIRWARTRAFINPDTGYFDAPGLGNQLDSIYWDQSRRLGQIEKVLGLHRW